MIYESSGADLSLLTVVGCDAGRGSAWGLSDPDQALDI